MFFSGFSGNYVDDEYAVYGNDITCLVYEENKFNYDGELRPTCFYCELTRCRTIHRVLHFSAES